MHVHVSVCSAFCLKLISVICADHDDVLLGSGGKVHSSFFLILCFLYLIHRKMLSGCSFHILCFFS